MQLICLDLVPLISQKGLNIPWKHGLRYTGKILSSLPRAFTVFLVHLFTYTIHIEPAGVLSIVDSGFPG